MPVRSGGFLVQGTVGAVGNYEVVVPAKGGGLLHYWRNNDDPDPTNAWGSDGPFATDKGTFSAAALIQSSYGNLELVGVAGDRLLHYFRAGSWQLGKDIGGGVRWGTSGPSPNPTPIPNPTPTSHQQYWVVKQFGTCSVVQSDSFPPLLA